MHNGRIPDVTQAALWYRPGNPQRFEDNLDRLLPVPVPPQALPDLVDFLTHGLTDPRVAAESFPFDRPKLHRGTTARLDFADRAPGRNLPPAPRPMPSLGGEGGNARSKGYVY